MKKNKINKHFVFCMIFVLFVGIIIGIQWRRKFLFPLPQLKEWKQSFNQSNSIKYNYKNPILSKSENEEDIFIHIPVEYLPNYNFDIDKVGEKKIYTSIGEDTIIVNSNDIALILIDTWGYPNEPDLPDPIVKKQKKFLERLRTNNITIIHAPNSPVVEKYPQYHMLKKIVEDSLKKYNNNLPIPTFMSWPSYESNQIRHREMQIRKEGRGLAYELAPKFERDISRHLRPLSSEYVLETYEELRYVLWKHKIKLLIYMGGAANECMLHRDTGINRFAGIDNERVPITIVVLEDCSPAGGSPTIDAEIFTNAIHEYFKFKLAFISNSEKIIID